MKKYVIVLLVVLWNGCNINHLSVEQKMQDCTLGNSSPIVLSQMILLNVDLQKSLTLRKQPFGDTIVVMNSFDSLINNATKQAFFPFDGGKKVINLLYRSEIFFHMINQWFEIEHIQRMDNETIVHFKIGGLYNNAATNHITGRAIFRCKKDVLVIHRIKFE